MVRKKDNKSLGDRFVKEVIDKIRLIEQNPERYPTRYKFYKETPVTIFPFSYYLQDK